MFLFFLTWFTCCVVHIYCHTHSLCEYLDSFHLFVIWYTCMWINELLYECRTEWYSFYTQTPPQLLCCAVCSVWIIDFNWNNFEYRRGSSVLKHTLSHQIYCTFKKLRDCCVWLTIVFWFLFACRFVCLSIYLSVFLFLSFFSHLPLKRLTMWIKCMLRLLIWPTAQLFLLSFVLLLFLFRWIIHLITIVITFLIILVSICRVAFLLRLSYFILFQLNSKLLLNSLAAAAAAAALSA